MATFFEFSGLGKDIFLKKNTITPKAQDNKNDIFSIMNIWEYPIPRLRRNMAGEESLIKISRADFQAYVYHPPIKRGWLRQWLSL